MEIKIFNNLIDVVTQRGVLVLAEGFGFGYLILALRSNPFNREEALIGLTLVLAGALFEYLITMAKVRYSTTHIGDRWKDIERLEARLQDGMKYIENKQDEIQLTLDRFGKGTAAPAKLAQLDES